MGQAKLREESPLISVLIPVRGRPDKTERLVESLIAHSDDDARYEILLAVDEDDEAGQEFSLAHPVHGDGSYGPLVRFYLWPRPPTLGDKLNRLAGEAKGDIFWFIANDYEMATPGWPEKFRAAIKTLPNQMGVLFPNDAFHGDHAAFPILSRRMVGAAGFFMAPWFPYWFIDTWWDEVGVMCDIRREIDVEVRHQDRENDKSTGIKDLDFWVDVFTETRAARFKQAIDICALAYGGQSPQFHERMAGLEARGALCAQKIAHLRNPIYQNQWEAGAGRDLGPHYEAVKLNAAELLNTLKAQKPKRVKVAIAIPSGRTWEAGTAVDVAGLCSYACMAGIEIMIANLQTSMISQSRNGTVELALQEKCDYIMWIDSDMRFSPDTLVKLLSHQKDIVGCVYNKRVAPFETLGKLKGSAPPAGTVLEGLHEADLLPGGLILVKTDVYRKMGWPYYFETYRWPGEDGIAAFRGLLNDYFWKQPDDEALVEFEASPLGRWIRENYLLGENGEKFQYWSEDHAFCRKARRHGFQVWCDITLSYGIKHLGVLEVTCNRQSSDSVAMPLKAAAE